MITAPTTGAEPGQIVGATCGRLTGQGKREAAKGRPYGETGDLIRRFAPPSPCAGKVARQPLRRRGTAPSITALAEIAPCHLLRKR